MTLLTRAQILETNDFAEVKTIYVPEWDGDVMIRAMSASERDLYEQDLVSGREKGRIHNVRARLLASVMIDEEGKQIFTEDDIEALGRKSIIAVDRVFSVAQKMNALTNEDVEDLEKNLQSDQTDSSSSS